MAKSLNQVVLLGNLTRDPEVRSTPSGQSVCSFSLALNRSYKDSSGNWQESTDFIDVVAWGFLAERASRYLAKGKRALVTGRLQQRTWEQDGQKRSKVEVLASDISPIDGYGTSDGGSNYDSSEPAEQSVPTEDNSKNNETEVVDEEISIDDIPF